MTNEEFQRTVDFILRQQAQFAADAQALQEQFRESQKRAEEFKRQADERMTKLESVVLRLAHVTETSISALTEAQQRTDKKMAETDERLNSLINVFERYISEKRNGKSEG